MNIVPINQKQAQELYNQTPDNGSRTHFNMYLLDNNIISHGFDNLHCIWEFYKVTKNKTHNGLLILSSSGNCSNFAYIPLSKIHQLDTNTFFCIKKHVFEHTQSTKLYCDIFSEDLFIETHLKSSFEIEGSFKKHILFNGTLKDVTRLSCFKSNYQYYSTKKASILVNHLNEKITIGDEYTEDCIISNDDIKKFAEVSGDFNPLHINKNYAQELGFTENIVHGMLSAGFFSKIIATNFPGIGSIYLSQDLHFLKPIYPNQKLRIKLRVISILGLKIILNTSVYHNNDLCLTGKAKIINKSFQQLSA